MESSDFVKATGNSSLTFHANDAGRMSSMVVVVNGKEYFRKQLPEQSRGDLRLRMALYKEFNVGRQIDCPYIVKYTEINEDENGVYVLMEHVNGMSMAEKMKAEPAYFSNLRNTTKLLRQLLKALKALHSKNIAYLDLKPENIMLTQVSNNVKLIDLGGCFADSNSFTAERTKAYAAPELANDLIGEVDARTDIYGVGKLIEYIEVNAGVRLPEYLKQIKQRCLQEDKTQRYATADAVLDALNRKVQVMRGAIYGMVVLVACALGWQWYSSTEHYHRTSLWLRSDALIDGVYYAKSSEDSATCCVMGWKDQTNLYLRDKIVIKGKEYTTTEIADGVFKGREEIESVFFPKGLRRIGAEAFFGCKSLLNVTLPEGFTELGHACFKGSGVKNVSFPKSLKSIGHASFAECNNMTGLVIPEGVETLEMDAFACCANLVNVRLPSTLKTISRGVFWDCPGLTEITIPAGVTTIGEFAFFYCNNLKHVYNYAPEPQAVSVIFKFPYVKIHVPAASVGLYRNAQHWEALEITGDL